MIVLTEENIDFIYHDVQRRGIGMGVLLDEMVDHICCTLESKNENISFETAYGNLINSLEKSTFKKVQHQTLLSTNLKFQIMKKSMIILGSLSALLLWTGSILKMYHIPPASMLLSIGTMLTILGFFPLFFYTSYKEQFENKSILLSITGYLTISFLMIGILFKVMHWPGAAKSLLVGELLLILLFLPLYLVNAYKKASEAKARIGYTLLIVFIGFGVIFMISATRLSKNIVDNYDSMNKYANQVSKKFTVQNESLLNALKQKEDYNELAPKIEKLNELALNLNQQIELIKAELTKNVDKNGEIKSKDDVRAFGKAMLKDDNAYKLRDDFNAYRAYALELVMDEYKKETLNALLDFKSLSGLTYEQSFRKTSLIIGLTMLSNMQKNIEITQYEILNLL